MTAREYLSLLLQQWRVIVAAGLIGVVIAGVVVLLSPVKYSASVSLYISTQQNNSSSTDAYQGSLLSQDRVKSYTELLSSYRLGEEVRNDLGLTEDPQAIADEISASVSPNTVLLTAAVTDESPERAQAIAGAIGRQFPALISLLERPANRALPPAVTATVVQGPILDSSPVSPRPLVDLTVGLVAGLLVGMSAAVLRRSLDRSVRTSDQLATVFPKPLLGTLGDDKAVGEAPLFLRDRPTSPLAESMRGVRTNFELFDFDRASTVFAVTSAVENEGKSTLLVNLAYAEAGTGKKVLIIEGDLRKPRAATYLGLASDVGLTQVLAGRATLADLVQTGPVPRLHVLATGPLPPNPCEMIESGQMASLLESARQQYDLVLVDAPPLLPVADGLALARRVHGVVFTVRASFTSSALVRRAHDQLEAAGVRNVGVVLNRVTDRTEGNYAGYYYSDTNRGAGAGAPTTPASTGPNVAVSASPVPSPRTAAEPSLRRTSNHHERSPWMQPAGATVPGPSPRAVSDGTTMLEVEAFSRADIAEQASGAESSRADTRAAGAVEKAARPPRATVATAGRAPENDASRPSAEALDPVGPDTRQQSRRDHPTEAHSEVEVEAAREPGHPGHAHTAERIKRTIDRLAPARTAVKRFLRGRS